MHFSTLAVTAMLALFGTAMSSIAYVQNLCPEIVYITIINSTQQNVQYAIAEEGTYSQPIVGTGNSFGISKTADYFSPDTPKFIFGFSDSTADGLLYWAITSQDGDAFAGQTFRVQPSDASCATASAYDQGQVHVCSDIRDITLVLC